MTSLFDQHPDVHARQTDPATADKTVKSLAKDASAKRQVLVAVALLTQDGTGTTDDAVLAHLEARLQRRLQRNVIARTRGLLEQAGLITRCQPTTVNPAGREVITFVISPMGEWALEETRRG